jgi:hypothetical protein
MRGQSAIAEALMSRAVTIVPATPGADRRQIDAVD